LKAVLVVSVAAPRVAPLLAEDGFEVERVRAAS
jgi:hypothetical protein